METNIQRKISTDLRSRPAYIVAQILFHLILSPQHSYAPLFFFLFYCADRWLSASASSSVYTSVHVLLWNSVSTLDDLTHSSHNNCTRLAGQTSDSLENKATSSEAHVFASCTRCTLSREQCAVRCCVQLVCSVVKFLSIAARPLTIMKLQPANAAGGLGRLLSACHGVIENRIKIYNDSAGSNCCAMFEKN